MPIQDNLNGALLISAIDFTLSFVIIGGIGMILAMFPLLNRLGGSGEQKRPAAAPDGGAASPAVSPVAPPAEDAGIHPGISDHRLVALLTAAASEALNRPVRVNRFSPVTAKERGWAAQGRSALQSHNLK